MQLGERLDLLSPRERQIVALAVTGLTDRAIANKLEIGPGTLKTYWARIRSKLGGVTRVELARLLTAEKASKQIAQLRAQNAELLGALEAPSLEEGPLRAFVDAMPDAVMAFDETGMVRLANPAAEELLGYEPGGLIGIHLRQMVPERFHGWHAEQRKQYEEQPERRKMGREGVNTALTRSGEEMELVTTMNRCFTDHGSLVVCILRPIG